MISVEDRQAIVVAIQRALAEDIGPSDVTSEWTLEPERQAQGTFLVKEPGIIAGLEVVAEVFRQVDPAVRFTPLVADGTPVHPGDVVARVEGTAISAKPRH